MKSVSFKSLDREVNALLQLTRSEIWGGELCLSDFEQPLDWSKIYSLAIKQTIVGVVANGIGRLPVELQPPLALAMKFHSLSIYNRKQYYQHINHLGDLIAGFDRLGVDRHMLLKGVAVAQYYPDPASRACGDIDIYVGERNYDKAVLVDPNYQPDDHPYHYHFNFNGVAVEIHRKISKAVDFIPHIDELIEWLHARIDDRELSRVEQFGDVKFNTMDATMGAFYIFFHGYKHLAGEGLGLRHAYDWALLIGRESSNIDSAELERLLKRYDLYYMWQVFATLAVDYLGLDRQLVPCYTREYHREAQIVFRTIIDGGNFGVNYDRSSRPEGEFARKIYTFRRIIQERIFMLRVNFRVGFPILCSQLRGSIVGNVKSLFKKR